MIYSTIFKRLNRIVPGIGTDLKEGDSMELSAPGYMDLHVQILYVKDQGTEDEKIGVSLAHYYDQNGDQMADPYMELEIVSGMKMAQAMMFQMDGTPIFQRPQYVYPKPGFVNTRAKKDQNSFLAQWLMNIVHQKHRPVAREAA